MLLSAAVLRPDNWVTYDNKGNRTHVAPSSGAQTCDTYDQANLLTKIQTGTGSTCTTPTTVGTYAYDGDGLRESKTVGSTTTQFTWNGAGGNVLQQYDGTTKTSFIYGPGGLPVEQIAGSTTTYLHHDQLGSIRLITDSAGATATATKQTWDPYGNSVTSSGSLTSPFGYAGMYLDSESGLYYAINRYYQPSTGQFLTVDPDVSTTRSPYGYVGGSPLNFRDPNGLQASPQPTCETPSGPGCAPPLPSNSCQSSNPTPGGIYSNGPSGGPVIVTTVWCSEETHTVWVVEYDLSTGKARPVNTGKPCDPGTWKEPREIPEPTPAPDWGIFGVAGAVLGGAAAVAGAILTLPEQLAAPKWATA